LIWYCAATEHGRPKVRRQSFASAEGYPRPIFSLATIASGVRMLTRYSKSLYTLTMLHLSVRDKRTVFGWVWAVLQPLALMLGYAMIVSRVAKVPNERAQYPVFVITALLLWVFHSSSISNATIGLGGDKIEA
jgi:ABC-type polysaccharide/polyol phosphate export permease